MSVFSKVYEDKVKEIEEQVKSNNENNSIFISNLFKSTVISSFEWENIPDFIKQVPTYIEQCLYKSGKVAFFKDGENFYIAPCFPNGKLLKNGMYSNYTMIFMDGTTKILPTEDIEICYNNFSGIPSTLFVQEMISRTTKALNAVDIALDRTMLPQIIECSDEESRKKIETEIEKSFMQKSPYAVTNGSFISNGTEKVTLYDDRETTIINIWDIFVRNKNLFFTSYGINNVEISKTERLTQAEGSSNTEITRYGIFYDMFFHRQDFCKRVKEHFGYELNVFVNRNEDTVTEFMLTNDEKIDLKKQMISPYQDTANIKNIDTKKEGANNDTTIKDNK